MWILNYSWEKKIKWPNSKKNGPEKKNSFRKKKNKILENRVSEWRQTIPRKKKYGTFARAHEKKYFFSLYDKGPKKWPAKK